MSTESIINLPVLGGGTISLEAKILDQGASAGLIMCHPHPLFSGTMDNKVVTTAVRAARDLGLNTFRFNFRGVGNSTGKHDNGRGEQEDVATAVKYARDTLGWQKIILGGFSFGAGVACLYACDHPDKLAGLFLLAPAVHHFDAPSRLPHEFETWVLMGNEDEVVPFDEVETWTELVVPQPHWFVFENAGHFFHGRLTDLRTTLKEELSQFV